MQFVTDFADQAIVLPAILLFTCVLALLGWPRGLFAWLVVVGASYSLILVLKLGFEACGSPLSHQMLRSPSGHTMSGTLLYGGVPVMLGAPAAIALPVAAGIAILIGVSRLALNDHTLPEAVLGGLVGLAAVFALTRLARPLPPRLHGLPILRRLALAAVILIPALALHSHRSTAESTIERFASTYLRTFLGCSTGPGIP